MNRIVTLKNHSSIKMKQADRKNLYERALASLSGERPEGNQASASIPVSRYLSRTVFEQERDLLRRRPLPVAAASELSAAGDWLSLDCYDTPLLLVRQPDGTVRAFLNVCRHRGARVVPAGRGHGARSFVCPYHAWTYKPDGDLKGLPQDFGFPCLDRSRSGLRRLAVSERAGMIWLILDPDQADQDIDTHLDPLMTELETQDLAQPQGFASRSYLVKANWKLLVDGAFEAYHFKIAHRNTIAHMFTDNLQIVDEFDLNRRLYLLKANFDPASPPPRDRFQPRDYGNIIYYFFPNTTFLVQPDHTQFSTLEPLAPGLTRVHETTLLPQTPDSEKARSYWQANVDLYRRTLAEDYDLAESIQSGLASGANEALTFGTFEYSAPRFHRQLQQLLEQRQPHVVTV